MLKLLLTYENTTCRRTKGPSEVRKVRKEKFGIIYGKEKTCCYDCSICRKREKEGKEIGILDGKCNIRFADDKMTEENLWI